MKRDFLIIADGPTIGGDQLSILTEGRTVVALDAAADKLRTMSITPDIILGDFDAIDCEYWSIPDLDSFPNHGFSTHQGPHNTTIVVAKNQKFTDMEKGILYCDSLGATSITVTDATSGRMDHTLGNISFLKKYHNPIRPLRMVSFVHRLQFLRNETLTVTGEVDDHCGIMGFPCGTLTTDGLTYDVKDHHLELAVSDSIANTFAREQARIDVVGEALLIW